MNTIQEVNPAQAYCEGMFWAAVLVVHGEWFYVTQIAQIIQKAMTPDERCKKNYEEAINFFRINKRNLSKYVLMRGDSIRGASITARR